MTQPRSAAAVSESPPRASTEPSVALAGEPLSADICVVGAGAGGIAVATLAAAFGRKIVLVEKQRMGGSILSGTMPSKALVIAGRRAQALRTASAFGIASVDPQIDYRAVQNHVRSVVSAVAPNESIERLAGLGIKVVLGAGRFVDKRILLAGDYRITARRFVLATGSSPAVPEIPGLETSPFLTSDTIFDVDHRIHHLVVIGAGTTGLELAQAYLRLGSRVTVLDKARALEGYDPEAAAVALKALRSEGLELREGATIERVEGRTGYARVHVTSAHGRETIDGTHLLVASGRTPNVSELNLSAAGIRTSEGGIVVNRGLRTSNRRVYAIGDVNGGAHFAHASNHQAEIVLRRALFRLPTRFDPTRVPRVTFTDPELAQVGLSEDEARSAEYKIQVLRWPFTENDRAHAEHQTQGHIKVVTDRKGRVLGATIVGSGAGELIQIWALAVAQKLHISALAGYVAPYPTLGEAGRRAAARHYATLPAKASVQRLIDFLAKLG